MSPLIILLSGALFVLFTALMVLINVINKGSQVEGVPLEGAEPERKKSLSPSQQEETDTEIRELLRAGRKIEAIKMYREKYGVDLKTAKDSVEAMD
jgi:ribosomal protein L7/L12